MDFIEPLLLPVQTTVDHSRTDLEQAAEESLFRQRILEGFLKGEYTENDVNDTLRMAGVEPAEFWEVAIANIDFVIATGIVPENLEFLDSGLVIPRHPNTLF